MVLNTVYAFVFIHLVVKFPTWLNCVCLYAVVMHRANT